MKKGIAVLLAALMIVLAGCSLVKAPSETQTGETAPTAGTEQTAAPETEPEQIAASETATEPAETESSVIDLPILDDIDANTEVATAGAYSKAVKSAENLLDWGCYTGLDPEEIRAGAEHWKESHDEETVEAFQEKLRKVDEVYLLLIGDDQEVDPENKGAWAWGRERVEAIEVIMEVFGLR